MLVHYRYLSYDKNNMDATEARTLTSETIQTREDRKREAAEQARLVHQQELIAHEQKIAEMAADMRREIDVLIENATKEGAFETEYTWESHTPSDSTRSGAEFNESEDKYAAYITMGDQLDLEGFGTRHTGVNLSALGEVDSGDHYQYSLLIDWYPKPEKPKSIFRRIGSKVAHITNKS